MEPTAISELISNLGFPIAAVIFLGWFVYKIYNDVTENNQMFITQVQARCKEREDWLNQVITDAQETNAKFVQIIEQYEAKLDIIKEDVKEIKQNLTDMK